MPAVATDQSVGQLIIDYRAWGRGLRAQYEALRAWAIGPEK